MSVSGIASDIVKTLKGLLPSDGTIGLHEPEFKGNERSYVNECIDTGWVSSVGKFVDRFESELADYTGARRAVAVVNGTSALHMALMLAGVRPSDEIIIPALTFVATANAVSYCGGVPHLADASEETLGIDPEKLGDYLKTITRVEGENCINRATGRRISAVVPMHTLGHPVDMDLLCDVAGRFNLAVVEDAAESLGSYYRGRHTGTIGLLGALSFNGNKIATTGGGGAILTNDDKLADMAKHLTTTARIKHSWTISHDAVGYNYRMPNINAALGCAQLERITGFVERKRALAARYAAAFEGIKGVRFFVEPSFARSNYWLNTLLLDEESAQFRDAVLEATNAAGIATRPLWTLINKLRMYEGSPSMGLSVASGLEAGAINLPSSAILGEDHVGT